MSLKAKRLSAKNAESPDFHGTPGRIRTCDPLIRSQVLYPAEPRALCKSVILNGTEF